jgi:hypothetical protein
MFSRSWSGSRAKLGKLTNEPEPRAVLLIKTVGKE